MKVMEVVSDCSTAKGYFKDNELAHATQLQLAIPLITNHPASTLGQNILAIHNRLGSLLAVLAENAQVKVESALAIWLVESGPYGFQENRPLLRFEVHKFWLHWGSANTEVFDRYFQFGGNGGISGSSWSNHKFLDPLTSDWQPFHGDQEKEYRAFALACALADKEQACLSSSFGGPQILGSNFAALGYGSAHEMFAAFAISERWHVCGFFDFCQGHGLLEALRQGDWHQFAKIYNGPGQADVYAERINAAYQASSALLQGLPEPIEIFDFEAFANFFQTLGVKNFRAHEFLFKGSLHSTMAHRAYGLNAMPPQELWPNIAKLARVLDRVRDRVNAPIMLTSIYRNAEYNDAIGGLSGSRHMQFSAVDFKIKNGLSPQQWCGELRDMRREGMFTGGVGLHDDAVHLDIRSENVDF